eukprot:CAMPEP_0183461514 /NCGR_PEP_ID=MMETSP0370-20130417/139815_1 /TAXON_ID=268820 /ORGANISM="Peridinium aciculiferum, Strain PAER-2" /LENGTH=137 /DNA_ID=CAMNT_0025653481 /DNA_START=38 /DNA_END=448 /DNA_ORIENTATION=+
MAQDLRGMFGDDLVLMAWSTQLVLTLKGDMEAPPFFPPGVPDHEQLDSECPAGWAMMSVLAGLDLWLRFGAIAVASNGHLEDVENTDMILRARHWSIVMFNTGLELAVQCGECWEGRRWPWRIEELLANYASWIHHT